MVGARRTLGILFALAGCLPGTVFAQAIAGTVRDASGAALPNVTVEATSAALMERVRTVASDSSGQYRIEDLRPGVYTITFTRAGFRSYARAGVEISSAFTAGIDAQLEPGPVAESITVTAAPPAVDVRNAAAATTLTGDIVRALPTVRSYNSLVVLIPGVATRANDIVVGTTTTAFPIHGGREIGRAHV